MPRIAIISSVFPEYSNSFTSHYVGSLSHALTQQGHDIHVITSAISEINAGFKKVSVHKIIKNWGLLDLRVMTPLFQQIKPDILHIVHPTELAQEFSQLFIPAFIETNKVLWNIPAITTIFDLEKMTWVEKLKLASLIGQSDEISVNQENIKNEICKTWPQAVSKTQVISLGAKDYEVFKTDPQERLKWDFKSSDKVFCYQGELTKASVFLDFSRACLPILKGDKNIKVLVASPWKEASFRHQAISFLQEEKVLNQFVFTGLLGEKENLKATKASDLLIFLENKPLSKNFSWKIRSALYSQAPVLTWNSDQNYDEFGIIHGENIWLSGFQDLESLAQDIKNLLYNPELLEKLSRNAWVFRAAFNFDTISNEFSRIYSKLLN